METFLLNCFLIMPLVWEMRIHTYDSTFSLSSKGREFRPKMNITLLLSASTRTAMQCAILCNELCSCRTFNFDFSSQQCQLFEADLLTGSIVSSPSPSSMVGTIRIFPPSTPHRTINHAQRAYTIVMKYVQPIPIHANVQIIRIGMVKFVPYSCFITIHVHKLILAELISI